jgi:hypothetical protein
MSADKCGFNDHLLTWLYMFKMVQKGPVEFTNRITRPIAISAELDTLEQLLE